MKIKIHHQTKYEYDRAVYLTTHLLRFKPAAHYLSTLEHFSLNISGTDHKIHWQQDPFNNFIARVDFAGTVSELDINVEITVSLLSINPFDFVIDDKSQNFPFQYEPALKQDLAPYLHIVDDGPQLKDWLSKLDQSSREIISFLILVNQAINGSIAYNIRMEEGIQTSEVSLTSATGSCRDSAWLLIQVLRHLGLAARFVSGYLIQLSDTNTIAEDQSADMVDLHAWAEVYIPGAGWIGLDPTSGLLAGEFHIPIACTASPSSAAPITGTSEKSETIFTFNSTVTRVNEGITGEIFY